ncbi:MAG: CdaR family protein [Chloroflexota bacterium]
MNWFFRNLRLLLIAVLLALSVWVSAVTSADPDEVHNYIHPVQLEIIGQDPSLVIVGSLPTQVTISLRAPHSIWTLLDSSDGQVRAILDLSGLQTGEHTINIQPQVKTQPVRVVSVSPESLKFKLEPLETVTLPIQLSLRGEPAIGYEAGTPKLDATQAIISGPESQIKQVERVQVDLSIAGVRQDIQTTQALRILDINGKVITGLTFLPENIQIALPITQQGGYRDIAVKVNVRGQQAGGYRVTNISVFPPVLTVYSKNPAFVNDLPGYVETEPLNLNGESQNVDTHLSLNLPSGVTIVGEQTVQVQVGIAAIEGSLSLNGIPVEITGLGPNLAVQISPGLVDVILTGPLPLLDKLTPGDIKFVVDLSGLTNGTHQATPQAIILIADIRVQSINPGTIEVSIIPGVFGSPTVTSIPDLTPTLTPTLMPTSTRKP